MLQSGDRASRDALEARGLIKVDKRGRYNTVWMTITATGLEWAEENLATTPAASKVAAPILQTWLTRISVYMSGQNIRLKSILGLADDQTRGTETAAESPAPPEPGPTLVAPFDYVALRARIRQAYLDLTGGRLNTRALLSDLREKLKDIDRPTLDEALKRMQREEEASLYQLDNRVEITDADRAAAIYFGIEPRHILWIER